MKVKRVAFAIIVTGALLLTMGMGTSGGRPASALPESSAAPAGTTIPYAGTLTDTAGQPVADGFYDFSFALYAAESGGEALWSEVQEGVVVEMGAFELALGEVAAIPAAALDGATQWLEVGVRGSGESAFTPLLPRQPLDTTQIVAPASTTADAACPHDHLGEEWYANVPWSNGAFKVYNYGNGPSIWGWNGGNGNGLRGYATGTGLGVYGESQDSAGIAGRSTNGRGVEAYSANGNGLLAHSDNSTSIYVDGAGGHGIQVASAGDHGVYVQSAGWSGVSVWSAAVAGMWVHSAGQDGILVDTAGWDGVHVTGPVGGVYYGAGTKAAEDFAVLNTGEVRSKVGFSAPANDFAVTMPVAGDRSVYEPGDVLIVSASGSGVAERSSMAYSPAAVGVYSSAPAFAGGRSVMGEDHSGGVPVAVLGIVPCKVSAENGPIRPGDLLVTSATPSHAMRADRESALPGTILGKALESLDSGTGIIQILVTLQ